MLYDVLIRLLAAIELSILFNIKGITTTSVVMSVSVFLLLEITILISNKKLSDGLALLPFVLLIIYYLTAKPGEFILLTVVTILALLSTGLSTVLYRKMTSFQHNLHRIRDDSIELESILRKQNSLLLEEQDQQVHLATLNERNRIAREIHDNVGHMLSRAILLLGAIQTVNKDESLKPQLEMLADTLDDSMAKMRASVHDLHDDSIDLSRNFDEMISELEDYTVNTDLDFSDNLPKLVKLSLIGILKESITNIIKHSNGDTVSIILHQNRTFCTLSVSDNGVIDSKTKLLIKDMHIEGIGLSNMKQRAEACGGDVYFYTNDGFTVFARLPYNHAE